MTHFAVGIIVPADEMPNIESFIECQMEPYDENTEAKPHVCYSVEQAAAEIDRSIRRLEQVIQRGDLAYDLDKCSTAIEELRRTTPEQKYQQYVASHEDFNDEGEPISTYNTESKWDWYRIGGRWDGWITGNEQTSDGGFNFGPGHETVENNVATTEQALKRAIIPHAIITPDGEWHERGQMGWFAILITENDDWEAQAREILLSYAAHHLVILDAHI